MEQIIQIICSRCAFFFTKRADRERMHPSRHPPNMLPGVELETAVFLTPRLAALSTKIVYYGKNRGYNAPKKQPVSYLFSLHPEPRVRSALAEAQNTSPSTYQVSRYDVHTKHTQRRKRQKKNIRHTHAKNAQQGEWEERFGFGIRLNGRCLLKQNRGRGEIWFGCSVEQKKSQIIRQIIDRHFMT